MVKTQNAAASTAKTASKTNVKITNQNTGVIYTLPSNGQATGASIALFIKNNAVNQLANVTVQLTPFGKSLLASLTVPATGLVGMQAINKYIAALAATNNGMFCTNCKMRIYQMLCYMLGVVPNSSKASKSKKYVNLHHATLGGNSASFNLGHINNTVKTHAGGKVVTSHITGGNTLAMLLTGTNTVGNKKHAFYGKPLVQLVVTPVVKTK